MLAFFAKTTYNRHEIFVVIRPALIESTALGAGYLAGLAVGFYTDKQDIKNHVKVDQTFSPQMSTAERKKLIAGWKEAVKRSFGWAKN